MASFKITPSHDGEEFQYAGGQAAAESLASYRSFSTLSTLALRREFNPPPHFQSISPLRINSRAAVTAKERFVQVPLLLEVAGALGSVRLAFTSAI